MPWKDLKKYGMLNLVYRLNHFLTYGAGYAVICKAEERGVAVATATDDNAADGDIGSAIIKIMIETLH